MKSAASESLQQKPEGLQGAGTAASPSRDSARIDSLLRQARAAHERGVLPDAERSYLDLLAIDADFAEVLHLLGALRFQQGRLADADELMRRAIALEPLPLALANHASVLAGLGRRDEALERLDEALAKNPAHPRALFQRAGLLAEQGRVEEAVSGYDQVLRVAPTSIDALCRRSAVLCTLGRFPEALLSVEQALRIDNRSVDALVGRGHVLHQAERYADAVEAYGRALAVAPDNADVLFLRGVSLVNTGQLQLALASFNEAIAIQPGLAEALYNSAVVLERLGRYEEAIVRCDRVLVLEPRHAKALANRGNALQNVARNREAAESYAQALDIEPDSIEILCNYARALRHVNRPDDALEVCDKALTLDGNYLPAWFSRGRVLQVMHRYEEALVDFEHVANATPDNRFAHFHRGNVLRALRRHEEADSAYIEAIALDPDYIWAHCMRAFLCLSVAGFEVGWREYEWRWRDSQMSGGQRDFTQPRWHGTEPIAGARILLHAEQGLGDTLQFCRYVSLVKRLGATVILEIPVEVKSLLATLADVDELVARGAPLPTFDTHCPLLSLPLAFKTDLESIPCDVPYLHADPSLVRKWRARLGTQTRPRIGLVWSGNPKHLNDRNRSLSFESLVPLLHDAFEWVCLQKVVRDEDRPVLDASPVLFVGDEIEDFADTAALTETMDCVLSVDTSVAHLAGAIGKPLWVMLPHTPDFRWLLDREDSPWYPRTRLFRQSQAGDWSDVLAQVEAALPSITWEAGESAPGNREEANQ